MPLTIRQMRKYDWLAGDYNMQRAENFAATGFRSSRGAAQSLICCGVGWGWWAGVVFGGVE
jgi:hypothetical protein